jgi:hypothetical protein
MAASEVLFVHFVAGADGVNMMASAEGAAIPQ